MKRFSIKLKITLWYTLAMIIVSSLVLFAMNSIGNDMIKRDISERLKQTVDETSRQFFMPGRPMHRQPEMRLYGRGVHMAVFDDDYNLLTTKLPFDIDEAQIELKSDELRQTVYDGNHYYEYDKKITPPGHNAFWIKGIVSVTDEAFAVNSVMKNNIILTIIMILIAAIGGYFIIHRAFIPVNRITKTAKAISEGSDLSERINIGKGSDEIAELANTFDEMLEKIEETVEREKQFTQDASHELRTPVSVILSECEYIQDFAKTPEEFKESNESIKRQAEKMSKLIYELLTISRMDKNTLKTNFEETDISELLSFVCDEQKEIQNNSITLKTDIEQDIKAFVDKFLLARLFINLISNAYQYSREDSEISVTLKKENENIIFSVSDNGIGISQEDLPKIWERFYRADPSRTRKENGSMGLGLSMVKWIAECHSGVVTVKSKLNEGSTFEFIMPAKKSS